MNGQPLTLRTRIVVLSAFLAVVVGTIVVAGTVPAHGSSVANVATAQPYGGCKEAIRYPRSRGARQCRRAGWKITRHFAVNPRGIVRFHLLRPCRTEGSRGPCGWDASHRGNRRGHDFIRRANGRTFRVHFPEGIPS